MSPVVFLGPSLSLSEACRCLAGADYRPPVTQGDVYRAVRAGARLLVLIDGEFDQVPAVWHKEILWALDQGCTVLGAASMGALRAAELCAFGMIGVGAIFAAYRDRRLRDDDEVAVAYARVGGRYLPLSEAMVNIRATLRRARRAGCIGPRTRRIVASAAKSLFYPRRDYPAALELAASCGASAEELTRFAAWWPRHKLDLKRRDALAVLRQARRLLANPPGPSAPNFVFHRTTAWQHLMATAEAESPAEPALELRVQAVLDELWLQPQLCLAAHRSAAARPAGDPAQPHLLAWLRQAGAYTALRDRALHKQRGLLAQGWDDRGEGDEELEAEALLDWLLHHPDAASEKPAFLALARARWREFLRALIREQLWQKIHLAGNDRQIAATQDVGRMPGS